MTSQQVREALDIYEGSLTRFGAKPVRIDTSSRPRQQLGQQEQANHLLWMCGEAKKFLDHVAGDKDDRGIIEKAMRWLGFIQGGLWSAGLFSIDQMKDHNR